MLFGITEIFCCHCFSTSRYAQAAWTAFRKWVLFYTAMDLTSVATAEYLMCKMCCKSFPKLQFWGPERYVFCLMIGTAQDAICWVTVGRVCLLAQKCCAHYHPRSIIAQIILNVIVSIVSWLPVVMDADMFLKRRTFAGSSPQIGEGWNCQLLYL